MEPDAIPESLKEDLRRLTATAGKAFRGYYFSHKEVGGIIVSARELLKKLIPTGNDYLLYAYPDKPVEEQSLKGLISNLIFNFGELMQPNQSWELLQKADENSPYSSARRTKNQLKELVKKSSRSPAQPSSNDPNKKHSPKQF